MITLFGSSYGALVPWLLMTFPFLLAALIYLYKRKGYGKEIVASSVLILKKIQRKTESRRKFFPPPRFFFELLLLILLSLAMVGIYQVSPTQNVAFLIDNSFSMSALRSGSTKDALTLAKEKGLQILAELPSDVSVEVFETSPKLRSLTTKGVKKAQAKAAINSITLAYAEDRLQSASSRLNRSDSYGKIFIFTDNAKNNTPSKATDHISVIQITGDYGRVSENNVAISNISLSEEGDGAKKKVRILVTSYADTPTSCVVKSFYWKKIDGVLRSEEAEQKQLALAPLSKETLSFEVAPTALAFSATLSMRGSSKSSDVILDDNQAWISLEQDRTKVALIGELTPKDLGLDQIKSLRFVQIDPQDYAKGGADLEAAKFLIFHRATPPALPPDPALLVLPKGEGVFQVEEKKDKAEISGWSEGHPLLKYLNLSTLKGITLYPVKMVAGLRDVIRTDSGIALAAAEMGKLRIAVLGFEIFPYEGKRAPLLSILTLNIFDWLSSRSLNNAYLPVRAQLEVSAPDTTVRYLEHGNTFGKPFKGVESEQQQLSATNKVTLPFPGLVRVLQGGKEYFVAVNYFNDRESNLHEITTLQLPQKKMREMEDKNARRSFVQNLAMICFVLLVIDFFVMLMRRKK